MKFPKAFRRPGDDSALRERVLEALSAVNHPTLRTNLIDLGFVKNLRVDGGKVSFDIELAADSTSKDALRSATQDAVSGVDGVDRVDVSITARASAQRPQQPQPTPGPGHGHGPGPAQGGPSPLLGLKDVKHTIAVASGKGGVGKSTTSVSLARALARSGYRTGILDADIHGPSVPTMLGVSERPQAGPDNMIRPIEAAGLRVISMGFLAPDDSPAILRGPMVHNVLQQFLGSVAWGPLDYLILDLPPGTGDVQLSLAQLIALSGAVVVTTPQEVSLVDVRRAIKMFEKVQVPVLGLIENMSGFVCPHCEKESPIFAQGGAAKLSGELGLPVLGKVPLDARLVEACDRGEDFLAAHGDAPAAAALTAAAGQVVTALAQRVVGESASMDLDWKS